MLDQLAEYAKTLTAGIGVDVSRSAVVRAAIRPPTASSKDKS